MSTGKFPFFSFNIFSTLCFPIQTPNIIQFRNYTVGDYGKKNTIRGVSSCIHLSRGGGQPTSSSIARMAYWYYWSHDCLLAFSMRRPAYYQGCQVKYKKRERKKKKKKKGGEGKDTFSVCSIISIVIFCVIHMFSIGRQLRVFQKAPNSANKKQLTEMCNFMLPPMLPLPVSLLLFAQPFNT